MQPIQAHPASELWNILFKKEPSFNVDSHPTSNPIAYKGPKLSRHHEIIFSNLILRASDKSLTKELKISCHDAANWIDLGGIGNPFEIVNRILEDLDRATLILKYGPLIRELKSLVDNLDYKNRPDGDFLEKYIENCACWARSENPNIETIEIETYLLRLSVIPRHGEHFTARLDPLLVLLFEGFAARKIRTIH